MFVIAFISLISHTHAHTNKLTSKQNKILSVLNYTKKSGSHYNGGLFQSGYHSFTIDGAYFKGQREPSIRLKHIDPSIYDFTDKTVLDIGCNQGGMLFAIVDKIKYGVGIDYDTRMINACNKLRTHFKTHHLDFYTFDLEKEQLSFIPNLLPQTPVDICFLLSMCTWLTNWKNVIDFAHSISHALLFESNGGNQQEQVAYLKSKYATVRMLSESSDDDPRQKFRQLFICLKK